MAPIFREGVVGEFWRWFTAIAPRLADTNFGDNDLIEELDRRVSELGPIGWELGPGEDLGCAFTLTPDGDPERLSLTESLIAAAPSIPGFELHAAKQPKRWDLRFTIEGSAGDQVDVDARSWRYVLLRFPENAYDIIVETPNLAGRSDEERWRAAVLVVDGMIGERDRLRGIANVGSVVRLGDDDAGRASSVRDLAHHWRTLGPAGGGA